MPLPSPILSPDEDNSFYILKEACWKRAVQAQTALCGPFKEEMIEEVRWDGTAGLGWAGAREPLSHLPCVSCFCSKAQLGWTQAAGSFLALVGPFPGSVSG